MNVSVIIPVYNASKYVTQAVESALAQPETAEVLLIEDGSTDDSLAVCQSLAEMHDKVNLLQHPGGMNRGAGASRNLGMQNANCEYIAFLDADDFFLLGRFSATRRVFESNPTCECVYEAMGVHFQDDLAKQQWHASLMGNHEMTTMTKIVPPEKLFKKLVLGDAGYFSICGMVVKRTVLKKTGFMNESLRLHQDTDFIFRLAAVGRLLPGSLEQPVVMRRVHGHNRISAPRSEQAVYQARMKMWLVTHDWLKERGLKDERQVLYMALLKFAAGSKPLPFQWITKIPTVSGQPSFFAQLARIFLLPFDHPIVIFTWGYWKLILSISLSAVKRNLRRLLSFITQNS
jgi:glycosyltransferase involved in cell wall biosynthesis